MKLKELIITDDRFHKFNERLNFYENSCDITLSIANYLNSPDIKKIVEDEGPYLFKDISPQDQLILVKLQYEGRIKELEEVIQKQKKEIKRLNGDIEENFKGETVVFEKEPSEYHIMTSHEEDKEDMMSTRKFKSINT